MASEVLAVPEEHLRDVIKIIRNGLKHTKGTPKVVRQQLKKWCDEEEEYLDQ